MQQHSSGTAQGGSQQGEQRLVQAWEQLLQAEKAYCQESGQATLPSNLITRFSTIRQEIYGKNSAVGTFSKQLVTAGGQTGNQNADLGVNTQGPT